MAINVGQFHYSCSIAHNHPPRKWFHRWLPRNTDTFLNKKNTVYCNDSNVIWSRCNSRKKFLCSTHLAITFFRTLQKFFDEKKKFTNENEIQDFVENISHQNLQNFSQTVSKSFVDKPLRMTLNIPYILYFLKNQLDKLNGIFYYFSTQRCHTNSWLRQRVMSYNYNITN